MKIITKEELCKRMAKGKDMKDIYVGNLHTKEYDNKFLMYHVSNRNMNHIMADDAIIVDLESDEED